jgi:uncharacterized protein
MALTCYLAVWVVGFFLFDLTGWYQKVSALTGTAIGVSLYGAMLIVGRWWFGQFRFGPVEWLWRSFTHGQRQVMRYLQRIQLLGAPT